MITFGHGADNDYTAENITYDEYARPSFDLLAKGDRICRLTLGVQGEHNVYNALAAVAAAVESGISYEDIAAGLTAYTGTNRRFEKKGELNGVTIIDDYAHHPQEIEATLKAARNYPHKRIWCAFQPHTYSRTKSFLEGFAESLSLADCVILADIYAARETDTLGVSSDDLRQKLEAMGKEAYFFPTFDQIENFLLENCVNGDLLITMGAGDVVIIGDRLLGL